MQRPARPQLSSLVPTPVSAEDARGDGRQAGAGGEEAPDAAFDRASAVEGSIPDESETDAAPPADRRQHQGPQAPSERHKRGGSVLVTGPAAPHPAPSAPCRPGLRGCSAGSRELWSRRGPGRCPGRSNTHSEAPSAWTRNPGGSRAGGLCLAATCAQPRSRRTALSRPSRPPPRPVATGAGPPP